jgi:hypothetical protein
MTSVGYQTGRCHDCGERLGSDSGRHYCEAIDNHTGFRISDSVRVGDTPGVIARLKTTGDTGFAEVYFRAGFRFHWYPTSRLERVAA